ncbi:unnamed protein product [Phytophthora fragariaefolia]|uniref:Unnamed protein product n=1 Tax=Phytophthora fragariaefolia TaxID=1490495 RepID=A0A9W7DF79_9STRA|nr:unnamed protein product [Phytophthora fragariaefolia]
MRPSKRAIIIASTVWTNLTVVVLELPDDPACSATSDMIYAGLMAVTDPACLEASAVPGCNLFGIRSCRVCAVMPEGVSVDTPPCELLSVFSEKSAAVAFGGQQSVSSEDCECEPDIPPPLTPIDPLSSIEPVESPDSQQSSQQEDYVPIVIVLPTDVFIEAKSSVWTDSEASSDDALDSDAGNDQEEVTTHNLLHDHDGAESAAATNASVANVCSGGWAPKLQFHPTHFSVEEASAWRSGWVFWSRIYLGVGVLLLVVAFALLWLILVVPSSEVEKVLDWFCGPSDRSRRLQQQPGELKVAPSSSGAEEHSIDSQHHSIEGAVEPDSEPESPRSRRRSVCYDV